MNLAILKSRQIGKSQAVTQLGIKYLRYQMFLIKAFNRKEKIKKILSNGRNVGK